jgi:hypothetical protein
MTAYGVRRDAAHSQVLGMCISERRDELPGREDELIYETNKSRMMPSTSDTEKNIRNMSSNSKLSRIIDEYGLDELGNRVENYWLADAGDRYSLRELAEYINLQLLRTVMHDVGMDPLDGEVENTYRLLTDDNVSPGTRTQARRRLERAGVDVDQLDADFVSRQAVHTYLTAVRGVTYTADEGDPVDREATNIRRLKQRLSTITNDKLEQLQATDQLTLGEFNVLLDLRVLCEDCGTQYQLNELLDARTCECGQDLD